MAKKKSLPEHALIVTEYEELRQLVLAFATGYHESMTIVGDGADAKLVLIARLLADLHFDTFEAPEAARERDFKNSCGSSRATYYRYKSELLERRGNFDLDTIRDVVLEPPQADPYTASLVERRRQLEELRDGTSTSKKDKGASLLLPNSGADKVLVKNDNE